MSELSIELPKYKQRTVLALGLLSIIVSASALYFVFQYLFGGIENPYVQVGRELGFYTEANTIENPFFSIFKLFSDWVLGFAVIIMPASIILFLTHTLFEIIRLGWPGYLCKQKRIAAVQERQRRLDEYKAKRRKIELRKNGDDESANVIVALLVGLGLGWFFF